MKTRACLALLLALSWGGCRKAAPSPEYASAAELYSSLYRQAQDDAYQDPRMAEVQALLAQVSPESRDAPAAAELLAKINEGRARVDAEAFARRQAIAEALKPTAFEHTPDPAPGPSAGAGAAPLDAGFPQPTAGMGLGEFTARFGECFRAGPQVLLAGKGPVDSFELRDLKVCRDRHPNYGGKRVAVESGKVLGVVLLELDAGRTE